MSDRETWDRYKLLEAYATTEDVREGIAARYGELEGNAFWARFRDELTPHLESGNPVAFFTGQLQDMQIRRAMAEHGPSAGLVALPVPEFLVALDAAHDLLRDKASAAGTAVGSILDIPPLLEHVDQVFRRHGLPYRADPTAPAGERFTWGGDPLTREQALGPVEAVLGDPRLGAAPGEFAEARRLVGTGRAKDRELAVTEAAKAIESAMAAVLEAHDQRVTKMQANVLWGALRTQHLVDETARDVVLAGMLTRTTESAHGAGLVARDVTPSLTARCCGNRWTTACTL